jgi:hypothetical protein
VHADLDTLCTAVYWTADDLLPERPANARRRVSDTEAVALCVAQAIMGIRERPALPSRGREAPLPLFPAPPAQPTFHKRRRRLADTIEWLVGIFASQRPGAGDDGVLLDSTSVECGRARPAQPIHNDDGHASLRADLHESGMPFPGVESRTPRRPPPGPPRRRAAPAPLHPADRRRRGGLRMIVKSARRLGSLLRWWRSGAGD